MYHVFAMSLLNILNIYPFLYSNPPLPPFSILNDILLLSSTVLLNNMFSTTATQVSSTATDYA
ncbi:hypothetical protein C8Q75DRAFT_740998 [Abortiporus biennis]|nr:hypothetical protein C8Q75DRAFT_740997 [Abortiporus biennis]KAI0798212.1 hypothetical protein C8Q75DRAFT_740998 [Abortiporus biennis]